MGLLRFDGTRICAEITPNDHEALTCALSPQSSRLGLPQSSSDSKLSEAQVRMICHPSRVMICLQLEFGGRDGANRERGSLSGWVWARPGPASVQFQFFACKEWFNRIVWGWIRT